MNRVTLGRVKEAKVEDAVCEWADTYGIEHIKLTPRGKNGFNDRLFFLPYRPLLIEFKAEGEEPRALQLYRHKILRELHYDVQVHDSKEEAVQAITDALGRRLAELTEIKSRKVFGGGSDTGAGKARGSPSKSRGQPQGVPKVKR